MNLESNGRVNENLLLQKNCCRCSEKVVISFWGRPVMISWRMQKKYLKGVMGFGELKSVALKPVSSRSNPHES